jgi:AraC-like DNA-binding protein
MQKLIILHHMNICSQAEYGEAAMYRIFRPAEPLRPYIDNYWMMDAPQPILLQENIFVDGKADILFNFGCAYQRRHLDQPHCQENLALSNLDGQRKSPVGIVQYGEIHLLGVRFKAGGLAAFVPFPVHEVLNQTVSVRDIFGRAADELEGRLYETSVEERIALLDSFFLRRLRLPPSYVMTLDLVRRLSTAMDDLAIGQLCHDAGYSYRSVDRFFRQFFGISPKFYARIVRFQGALRLLSQLHVPISEIAFRCGYYDQAHLSSEFQAFAAQTPSQYRGHLLEKAASPPPNLVPLLQEQ